MILKTKNSSLNQFFQFTNRNLEIENLGRNVCAKALFNGLFAGSTCQSVVAITNLIDICHKIK